MTKPRRRNCGINKTRPYGLRDEKIFLEFLGTYRVGRDISLEDRARHLERYIATIGQRTEKWVPAAREYARDLLRKLRAGEDRFWMMAKKNGRKK